LRVDGDAHDAISSQQPVERWHGAISGNLVRTLSAPRVGTLPPQHAGAVVLLECPGDWLRI
jgi:hypothetical protein